MAIFDRRKESNYALFFHSASISLDEATDFVASFSLTV